MDAPPRERGFYKYAKPTDYQTGQFDNERARGRVTVEQGAQSMTVLSMRGQGLSEATKGIPALYSESKRAIMYLRNSTTTLNVSQFRTESLR